MGVQFKILRRLFLAVSLSSIRTIEQVCVAIRDTAGTDENNPFSFDYVRARIEHALREFEGAYTVVPLPNVTHVFYGRDVGYTIEKIDIDASLNTISATEIRGRLFRTAGQAS